MKAFPIKNTTAFVSMLSLSILSIVFGLILQNIQWGSPNRLEASSFLIGMIIIPISIIGLTEIGLKKFSNISNLRKLSTQQWVGLLITLLVLITGIFYLFDISLGFFGNFAGGTLIVQGLIILVEIFR